MSDYLNCIEQEPATPATASVIWMHGLGATAHDFETVPPVLGLPSDLAVRFIFPQAPSIPVTLNGGMVMPAWYDIREIGSRGQDADGIRRSEQQLVRLIEREIERGVAAERIVIGGFSQGGAMALHTGLRFPSKLAGVMVLSGYLLMADQLAEEASVDNRQVSIFQAHGRMDPMVRFEWATTSKEHLEKLGYAVEWHEYMMMHQVCEEEIQAIGQWLTRVLS